MKVWGIFEAEDFCDGYTWVLKECFSTEAKAWDWMDKNGRDLYIDGYKSSLEVREIEVL